MGGDLEEALEGERLCDRVGVNETKKGV